MSEILAVQLTAVGTLALAVFALATAVLAYMAWRKQSREVRDQTEMLKVQAEQFRQSTADRERDAMERRRAQALLVYLEEQYVPPAYDLDPYTMTARVYNTSQQPVYGLRFRWHVDDQPTDRELWHGSLMPGTSDEDTYEPGDVAPGRVSAMVGFCDRAGVWWSIWADGRLEEMPKPSPPSWAIRT